MNRVIGKMLCMAAIFCLPGKVWAVNYDNQFCATYTILGMEDANSSVGDDYYTNVYPKTAMGAWLVVYRLNFWTGQIIQVEWQGYSDYTGDDAGCTPELSLSSSYKYRVDVVSKAQVGSIPNYTYVMNNDEDRDYYGYVLWTAFIPGPANEGKHYRATSASDAWKVLSAASYSQYRRRGGLIYSTYRYYLDNSPCNGGSCTRLDDYGDVACFLSSNGRDRKYIIVHETGHALGWKVDEMQPPNTDSGADYGDCVTDEDESHEMNQKEYQSNAAKEGFAHFYAATIFNDDTEYDCWYEYYKSVDWDLDGNNDDWTTNCEGSPMSPIPSGDYLGYSCDGQLANRAVEYDYLRFWWDMTTDQDVYFTDCVEIWDYANPRNWNDDDQGAGVDYVNYRLRDAADYYDLLSEWDSEDYVNGVWR